MPCSTSMSYAIFPKPFDRNDDIDFNLPLISHPLEKSHIAWIDWNRIEPAIMNYLDEHQVQWSMLDLCYRRRPGFPYNDIAEQPFAFVIAQKSDPIAWKALKEGIVRIIQRERPMKTIKVELMDGNVNPHLASMGSGIICRHSMATLGGYLHTTAQGLRETCIRNPAEPRIWPYQSPCCQATTLPRSKALRQRYDCGICLRYIPIDQRVVSTYRTAGPARNNILMCTLRSLRGSQSPIVKRNVNDLG
jgi:hypothetical protein